MTASRTSAIVLALALSASSALAQADDSSTRASAPPRVLGAPGAEQPPTISSDGLVDDGSDTAESEKPRSRPSREEPPNVSTDDLLDDNEDAPPKSSTPAVEQQSLPMAVEPAAPLVPKAGTMEVRTLGTIDGSSVGLLNTGNGGLEPNLWSGSARGEIEDLLSRVPLASPDGAVHALARRLILTNGEAPPGEGKRALITIRLEKLLGAGMVDEAGALAAAAELKGDSTFARVQADALLLAGRDNEICGDKTSARLSEGDLFWLELRAYCAAISGDTSTADLTRSVIDAQGLTDQAYNVLLEDILTKAKKPPGKISKPTALHLFLLRKAGLPIDPDTAVRAGGAAYVLVMRDRGNASDARLSAAERLLKTGAASAAELRAIVDAQDISADQTANALAIAPKLSFLKAQALLRRAAQLESRPSQKAVLVHQALLLGDKAGLFEVTANLQADVAGSIKAEGVAENEGPFIGWALLIAGKPAAASPWLGDNDVARAVLGLASGRDDTAQAALSNIATQLSAGSPKVNDASRPMEVLLLGLYDALGRAMPADAKAQAAAIRAEHLPGRRPDESAMQKMLAAAGAPDRKGEALLRILSIVGAKGPGDLAPDITIELVRALSEMNVKDAARAIAIHALLLYRPGTS